MDICKDQLAEKRENFVELFDTQIQRLKDRGCPEQIVALLENQRSSVLSKTGEMTFEEGHIPFLPVIPRTCLDLYSLMAMMCNDDDEIAKTHLKPTAITDQIETPEDPYYIFDVEDGEAMRGRNPQDAKKILKKQLRSPLTIAEVIALCIHTDVLSRHCVWADGSRYELAVGVPFIWLSDGGPSLVCFYVYVSSSVNPWGSASCGSR